MQNVKMVYWQNPVGGSASEFIVFVNKIEVQSDKSATKFLCVKIASSDVVVEPFLYLTLYRCWQ